MLAVICALQASPRLLLLDEPCGGLTSAKAKTILDQVVAAARERGAAAVIIEQRVREILAVADRVVIFRRGTILFSGPPAGLGDAGELRKRLFFEEEG
jgi:ABC-type branched-subunit amino acid transport system ATPase component